MNIITLFHLLKISSSFVFVLSRDQLASRPPRHAPGRQSFHMELDNDISLFQSCKLLEKTGGKAGHVQLNHKVPYTVQCTSVILMPHSVPVSKINASLQYYSQKN